MARLVSIKSYSCHDINKGLGSGPASVAGSFHGLFKYIFGQDTLLFFFMANACLEI